MPWQAYNSAGQLLQATDLPDSTVTASKLATNAVTNAKVADDAVGVAELSATGTASNSTFLRGDNAWAAAGGDLSFGGDTFGENKVIGANDAYSLSLETSGNTALTIAAGGEVTLPLQPAFSAYLTSDATNVTGNAGTSWRIQGMTEDFDRSGDFNASTGQFTAPVAGIYHFDAQAYMYGWASTTVIAPSVWIYKGNTAMFQGGSVDTAGDMVSSGRVRVTAMLSLAANDTVEARVTATNAGSNLVDIDGGNTPRVTWFEGYLVA